MRLRANRIIITPLDWASNRRSFLPFQLGFGFEVRDVSPDVANLDLEVWKRLVSDDERERVKGWSVCLVNNYREFFRGDRERLVETLMHYVVAHLRLSRNFFITDRLV
jgi:hypothetical protein